MFLSLLGSSIQETLAVAPPWKRFLRESDNSINIPTAEHCWNNPMKIAYFTLEALTVTPYCAPSLPCNLSESLWLVQELVEVRTTTVGPAAVKLSAFAATPAVSWSYPVDPDLRPLHFDVRSCFSVETGFPVAQILWRLAVLGIAYLVLV